MAKSAGSLVAGMLLTVCVPSAHAQSAAPIIPSTTRPTSADVGLVIAGSATVGFGAVALIVGLEGLLATYNPTGDAASAVWLSTGIGGSALGVVLLVLGVMSQDVQHARAQTFDDIIRF